MAEINPFMTTHVDRTSNVFLCVLVVSSDDGEWWPDHVKAFLYTKSVALDGLYCPFIYYVAYPK